MNDEHPELFQQPGIRYTLKFIDSYQNEYAYFTLWLEAPLNYGDQFEWDFMRAKQQTHSYYVDQITHEFSAGKPTVTVTLRAGIFNSYRKMLYDKGCFYDLISIHERYHIADYQMDRLLIHRVEKDLDGYPKSLSYLERDKLKH